MEPSLSRFQMLRFDLWMSGCYLWTIAPATERFFSQKLKDAGVRGRPLDQALSECFCTALGGANAYLDRYCQFENVQTKATAGKRSPLLIAFCYNQKAAVRKYDFYLLATVREEMVQSDGEQSILRAYLSKLPDSHSLQIADGEVKNGGLHSVRITDSSDKQGERTVPRGSRDDVKLVGELEIRLTEALGRMKSPAAAWRSVAENREFSEIFKHIPRSVQESVQLSPSSKAAISVLHGATCHPADAPVLMEIYEEKRREISKAGHLFDRFQTLIAKTDEADRVEPEGPMIPSDLMPRSVLLGRVCEIENQDEITVEFEVPSGERFVETFDRNRLRSVKADYYGAQVKYMIYENGSWQASRFALRDARSVAVRAL